MEGLIKLRAAFLIQLTRDKAKLCSYGQYSYTEIFEGYLSDTSNNSMSPESIMAFLSLEKSLRLGVHYHILYTSTRKKSRKLFFCM